MFIDNSIFTCEFFLFHNFIYGSFIKMKDNDARGIFDIRDEETEVRISSYNMPELIMKDNELFIPGQVTRRDDAVMIEQFNTDEDAKRKYDMLIKALSNIK